MIRKSKTFVLLAIAFTGIACAQTWNNPHQHHHNQNIRYGSFSSTPKTLDPARSYASNETLFTAQIYEPPLQYHFFKRPFALVPLTATKMPTITYYDAKGNVLPLDTKPSKVAYTIYDIYIKPGILYQPHPAFAKNNQGKFRYHQLQQADLNNIHKLSDFKYTGTRELTAHDYVYQIKRLAHPKLNSPILGFLNRHIVGLKTYNQQLQGIYQQLLKSDQQNPFLDLRKYPLEGVRIINRYHYQIKVKGAYPQFLYWLAMPFFAPVPWEADYFYSQPGMNDTNLTFDWYPVGTGPYMLVENNPNKQMILKRNPNFRGEPYPTSDNKQDQKKDYLRNVGKTMPFIDVYIFSLDKESIPRWNKFLQGYYDVSGISADSFDQAIKLDRNGNPILTPLLKQKDIRLQTTVEPAIYYIGFNMLDNVVGGLGKKKQALRQAIAIALNYEEYVAIFLNGRGIPAHGPIPPGIFGYQKGKSGYNPLIYDWVNGKLVRKPIAYAKKLLAEAGYPGGRDPKTGRPLILNYDVASSGSPDDHAIFNWMRKQFAKLGIKLNIRATLYNRFQDKVLNGQAQIFSWGWSADYPDPENFLFLLYGPNGKVKHKGENAANYANAKYDALFEKIRYMKNGPERQKKINELLALVRTDSPWVWGFHPISFTLSHAWNDPAKPHAMANNILKYQSLNPKLRHKLRREWNRPILWPFFVAIGFILLILIPLIIMYRRREQRPTIKRYKEN